MSLLCKGAEVQLFTGDHWFGYLWGLDLRDPSPPTQFLQAEGCGLGPQPGGESLVRRMDTCYISELTSPALESPIPFPMPRDEVQTFHSCHMKAVTGHHFSSLCKEITSSCEVEGSWDSTSARSEWLRPHWFLLAALTPLSHLRQWASGSY